MNSFTWKGLNIKSCLFGFFLNNQTAIHPDSAFYKYAELHSELHKNKPKTK